MEGNIKKNILYGLKWNAFGQFGRQGLSFAISIVLARILEPREFGLVSMLFIFTGLAAVFIDSGFGGALIQKKELSEKDCSSVFYFNISVSSVLYLGLFFMAPFIARFYRQPELVNLTRIICLVFLINSIGMVQSFLTVKELNFKKNNLIILSGVLVSGIVSLTLAFNHFGAYSIVFQSITYALVTNILYFYFSSWQPKLVFSFTALKSLFGFGSKMLLSSILSNIFMYVDNMWIGKMFNAAYLGYYFRGKSTRDLINNNVSGILSTICFPVFSKLNDNNEELIKYNHKLIRLVAYLIVPVFTGLLMVAKPFVIVVFSEKWLPSVPMLQLFCLAGINYPVSVILVQTIMAKGYSGLNLKLEIIKKSIVVIAMIIGLRFGVMVFLTAMVLESITSLTLSFYYTSKLLKFNIIDLFKDLIPALLLSISMALVLWMVHFVDLKSNLAMLIIMVFAGFIFYIGMSYVFKVKEFFTLFDVVKAKFSYSKSNENR